MRRDQHRVAGERDLLQHLDVVAFEGQGEFGRRAETEQAGDYGAYVAWQPHRKNTVRPELLQRDGFARVEWVTRAHVEAPLLAAQGADMQVGVRRQIPG